MIKFLIVSCEPPDIPGYKTILKSIKYLFVLKPLILHFTSLYLHFIISKQIIKYNRWQQRNGPNIHDVTSVKYNKENKIFSYQLTCFPRLNKKVQNQKVQKTKSQLFHCKISTFLSLLLLFVRHIKLLILHIYLLGRLS